MSVSNQNRVYVSPEIVFDIKKLEKEFSRADVEIHDVDHSGVSYEGRVFLNNPDANQRTPKDEKSNYAGSYHIFGHGGCFGDIGHCDYKPERRAYDTRLNSDIRPQYKRIIVTNLLKKLGKNTNKFTITIVPVLYARSEKESIPKKDIIKFDKIGFITYD
jgi:tyrosinase